MKQGTNPVESGAENGDSPAPPWNGGLVDRVPKEVLTTEYESTITLECCGLTGDIHLVDLLDGTVYALPEEMVETDGSGWYRLKHIPVRDSPLLLAFGDFVEMA